MSTGKEDLRMGYYINPPEGEKEDFLNAKGRQLTDEQVQNFDYASDELPVCLVTNSGFTAACIAFDPRERARMLRPDARPKVWYAVKKVLLTPWLPEHLLQTPENSLP